MREALTRDERLARAFASANDRLRDYVEQRISKDAMDIARLYRSSRSNLIDRLRHVYVQFLGDEPSFMKARQAGAGPALDLQIEMTVHELADSLGRHAVTRVEGLLAAQPAKVLSRFRRLGVPIAELPVTTRSVLNELTTSVIGGGTFFDRSFHMTDTLRRDVVGSVRQSLLQGESFDDLRSRLLKSFGVDKLDEPSTTAYGSVKHYRNEARRQWNLLMKDQADRAEGSIQVWWATLDEASTPGCVARHGYPIRDDLPPRHYNCRCTVAVFPSDTDLDPFKAEAMAWLQDNGYSRRRAMAMEATHAHYVGDTAGPHSHKGGTSNPEGMVKDAGGKFNGIQHVPAMGGKPERNYLMFTDIETGSTGMIPLDDATPEKVAAHLKDIRRRFGKEAWWWGESEIKSAYDTMNLDALDGHVYRSVPWREVPAVVSGSNRGTWHASLLHVKNAAQPDHVMLFAPQKTYANPRTYKLATVDSTVVPLVPKQGQWVPLTRGLALDSPNITRFDAPRVRFPLEIIQRWPQLRPVTFPMHRNEYDAAVVSPEQARMLTLGTLDPGEIPGEWWTSPYFDTLTRDLLAYPTHQDPYFVLAKDDAGLVVEMIVHLQTGNVIFSPEEFPKDLLAPYTRVAAVAITQEGLIWSVRPKGKNIYVLPGGHIDPGESPSEAVVRELKEETGVGGQLERELGRLYRPWSTTIVYIVRPFGVRDPVSTPDENDDVALIDLDQLVEDERLFIQRHGISRQMAREAEFDPAEHPRDDEGKFTGKGGGSPLKGLSDDDITPKVKEQLLSRLKFKNERTEDGARSSVLTRLHNLLANDDLVLYHEIPGDHADSVRKRGIGGGESAEETVFASINAPSDFVTSAVKTIVKFKIKQSDLKKLSPDMRYHWSNKLSAEQVMLLEHPDDLKGAYVSLSRFVKPNEIMDVQVRR